MLRNVCLVLIGIGLLTAMVVFYQGHRSSHQATTISSVLLEASESTAEQPEQTSPPLLSDMGMTEPSVVEQPPSEAQATLAYHPAKPKVAAAAGSWTLTQRSSQPPSSVSPEQNARWGDPEETVSRAWPRLNVSGVLARPNPTHSSAVINGQLVDVQSQLLGVTLRQVKQTGVVLEFRGEEKFVRVGQVTVQ